MKWKKWTSLVQENATRWRPGSKGGRSENQADQDVGVGGVFVEVIEKKQFLGFGSSGRTEFALGRGKKSAREETCA